MTEVLQATREMAATARDEAAAGEAGRQLTSTVVEAMREAGVFRMAMGKALGGPELSPLEQIDVVEALAAGDGAAGWCGMINCDGGYASAYLERDVAAGLYPSINRSTVLVANPSGRAVVEGDGFRVSGQWPFASGSSHADVFFLSCLVFDGDELVMAGDLPQIRLVGLERRQVEVLDTWVTTGLAGTASNDVKVVDVHVDRSRTFSLLEDEPVDPSPLYQWRWMLLAKMPAVPLGVARAAIDEARQVASTKVTMPSFALARDDGDVQHAVGRATALVRSARAYVDEAIGTTWGALESGRPPSADEWVDARLATTNAFSASKQAVTLLYEALGTTGVYRRSPLDRQLRDVTTMSQHMIAQARTYAASGRGLLGLAPALPGF